MSDIYKPASRFMYLGRAELPDDPDVLRDWNDWSLNTHVPELLAAPGFRSAVRMREVDGARAFVTGYEIDGPEAVRTQEYFNAIAPHRFTPLVKNVTRTLYQVTAVDPWADLEANS